MHIIAFLGVVIGAIGVWYWRFKAMRDVGSDVVDAVGRARGAYRMHNFRKKAESSVLASVDDPALGAAIFLFALANEADSAAHLAGPEIRRQLTNIVPADKMDEFIAYAEWAAKSVIDARDCVRRFRPLWLDNLTTGERMELLDMAQAIAALTPNRTQTQTLAIEALDTALTK
ncbi:hypothetical protein ABIB57_002489 [Devosia sp. UYZn731]|uniref:hypothetical protein n=1 Tax=Devosia sp. UYZn731 TaxID=3156345 RepID=UPI00339085AB